MSSYHYLHVNDPSENVQFRIKVIKKPIEILRQPGEVDIELINTIVTWEEKIHEPREYANYLYYKSNSNEFKYPWQQNKFSKQEMNLFKQFANEERLRNINIEDRMKDEPTIYTHLNGDFFDPETLPILRCSTCCSSDPNPTNSKRDKSHKEKNYTICFSPKIKDMESFQSGSKLLPKDIGEVICHLQYSDGLLECIFPDNVKSNDNHWCYKTIKEGNYEFEINIDLEINQGQLKESEPPKDSKDNEWIHQTVDNYDASISYYGEIVSTSGFQNDAMYVVYEVVAPTNGRLRDGWSNTFTQSLHGCTGISYPSYSLFGHLHLPSIRPSWKGKSVAISLPASSRVVLGLSFMIIVVVSLNLSIEYPFWLLSFLIIFIMLWSGIPSISSYEISLVANNKGKYSRKNPASSYPRNGRIALDTNLQTEVNHLNHLINMHIDIKSLINDKSPFILFHVYSVGLFNRHYLEGYGHFPLPIKSCSIDIEVKTWKPLGDWISNLSDYYLGCAPIVKDPHFIGIPENQDKFINKLGVSSESSGLIRFRCNCIAITLSNQSQTGSADEKTTDNEKIRQLVRVVKDKNKEEPSQENDVTKSMTTRLDQVRQSIERNRITETIRRSQNLPPVTSSYRNDRPEVDKFIKELLETRGTRRIERYENINSFDATTTTGFNNTTQFQNTDFGGTMTSGEFYFNGRRTLPPINLEGSLPDGSRAPLTWLNRSFRQATSTLMPSSPMRTLNNVTTIINEDHESNENNESNESNEEFESNDVTEETPLTGPRESDSPITI